MHATRPRAAVAAIALAAALAVVPPLRTALADSWERDFTANITSLDSNVQYVAVTRLDPQIPKARQYLYAVLAQQSWHLRQGAIDRLATATGDAIDDLVKEAKSHKVPETREGIVLAFGQMKSAERLPDIFAALGDKDAGVRRAAVQGILAQPTKEGVEALIAAIKKEKDFTVQVFVKEALQKLTRAAFGFDAVGWENWWAGHKEKWKAPKPKKERREGEPVSEEELAKEAEEEKKEAEEAAKEAEAEGKEKASEETTVLREVEVTFKEAGKGGPLFVLPAFERNVKYLENHIQALEDVARVFYIDLPPLSKFRGLKNLGVSGMPPYPLNEMSDAFDELRKVRKQEKIAIMAHAESAWVAMRYVTKYPNNVSHLILVSTWPSNRGWDDGRQRVEQDGRAKKCPEEERCAKRRVADPSTGKAQYEPKDPQEGEALERMDWTVRWADPRNAFAARWYKSSHVDLGCWIPEFDIGKEKSNPVPTLVVYGTKSLWSAQKDATVLSKVYPNSAVVACPNSADFPMIEDHAIFTKAVKDFFRKYPFRSKIDKKDKK